MTQPNRIKIERPSIEAAPYREETFAGYALGIVVGIVLTISMTYAGLKIGFTVPASAMAAMIGLGILRSLLKVGSIVENNINQTVAAAINITCSGIIFTVPILYLRGQTPDLITISIAAVAGSFLGTVFVIPLRKQMVDLERLRFPTGFATATVLKAAGGGNRAIYLFIGVLLGFLWFVVTHLPRVEWALAGFPELKSTANPLGFKASWLDFAEIDFHESVWHGIPRYINPIIELSMTAIAAGFIAGRPAFVVVWGGLLANWIVAPMAVSMGWVPSTILPANLDGEALTKAHAAAGTYLFKWVSRPIGIGMLVGGAIMGIILAWPMIRAAFQSLARGAARGANAQELSPNLLYFAAAICVAVVGIAGYRAGLPLSAALTAGIVASVWMWLAGVIVAQTTGVTDWSPISGMALISIVLMYGICKLFGAEAVAVAASVTMAVGVAVAMSQAADMMQDLKTGHLVGAVPKRQQKAQLYVAWIGPIVSVITLDFLYQSAAGSAAAGTTGAEAFATKFAAPQATALSGTIDVLTGTTSGPAGASAAETYIRYGIGGILGTLLTLAAGGGLGVQVGLSMYLPFATISAFGIGVLLSILYKNKVGEKQFEEYGIPVAAGLLVGDSLAGVADSMLNLFVK